MRSGLSERGTFMVGVASMLCGWFAGGCVIQLATRLFMMDVFENGYHAIQS